MRSNIFQSNPKEKSWIKYIKWRIRKNKNFISVTTGPTGSGKSWFDLSVVETLQPKIVKYPERITFHPLETLKLIKSGSMKRGDCFIMEEVGIQIDRHKWYSKYNKVIKYLFQTFRKQGYVCFMNVPSYKFIDSAILKLVHAHFSVVSIDFDTETTRTNAKLWQYNEERDKVYKKFMKVISPNSKMVVPLRFWNQPKPTQALIDLYEAKKDVYNTDLDEKLYYELKELEMKENEGIRKKHFSDKEKNIIILSKSGKKGVEVAKLCDCSSQFVSLTLKKAKKYGFFLRETDFQANQGVSTT